VAAEATTLLRCLGKVDLPLFLQAGDFDDELRASENQRLQGEWDTGQVTLRGLYEH
jgi:hypothetical protein